LLRIST